jgi:hypothetical protein
MGSYLDISIRFQEERVRNERKSFWIQFGVLLFNISMLMVNTYNALHIGNIWSHIGIGAMGVATLWTFVFSIDFLVDYLRAKDYLHELRKMRDFELTQTECVNS